MEPQNTTICALLQFVGVEMRRGSKILDLCSLVFCLLMRSFGTLHLNCLVLFTKAEAILYGSRQDTFDKMVVFDPCTAASTISCFYSLSIGPNLERVQSANPPSPPFQPYYGLSCRSSSKNVSVHFSLSRVRSPLMQSNLG